jgi:transcriptional regulator with XRE-family HTH domain
MEKLRAYVRAVMEQKGLSEWQVEKRAKGKIKDSYVKDILSGKTKSISVEKLNALAEGLGVDGIELYRAASGEAVVSAGAEDPWPSGLLFKAIDKIIHDPDFGEIVRTLLRSKAPRLKAIRKQLK